MAAPSIVSTFCAGVPVVVTALVAVVPPTVVRRVVTSPRAVRSIASSSGFQSWSYRTWRLRVTRSNGAPIWPLPVIVQPSAARSTEICSVPTGSARKKIVKREKAREVEEFWSAGALVDQAASATARASMPSRIEWNEAMSQDNTLVSAVSRDAEPPGYNAARQGAAFFDRADRGFIVVSGKDRASYLHGLLTNDITALKAGEGCYAAYLTPQGRMITDLWVYELGDLILLVLLRDVKDAVLAKLDQFIFTEDVQLGDVSETFGCVAVVGPDAAKSSARVLTGVSLEGLASLKEHGSVRSEFSEQAAIAARVTDVGEPGYDLFVGAAQREALKTALRAAGAVEVDDAVVETLRIEGGMPKFHRDMDEETIPLEAGIEGRAISLTKGCYVGQEVIIRVLHRGHGRVARRLVGITLEGEAVSPPGAVVRAGAREIGRVTSSARSPALQRPVAMAYVHRDFVAAGTPVTVDGGPGVVAALPFVPTRV